MSVENIVDIKPFNLACDEFIAGKYILADIKISSILKTIAANEKIKNLIASCLDNFNFDLSFKRAGQGDEEDSLKIFLPANEKELVAFVFNLLYYFDNKGIDFYDFISKYYKSFDEDSGKEFHNFATAVIIPFKNAINTLYSKRHVISSTTDYQDNLYNQIKNIVKVILKNIDNYKLKMSEKEEFTMLLNSLYISSDKNDKKLVYSLMIGLDYFTRCNKKCKDAYFALQDCFQ